MAPLPKDHQVNDRRFQWSKIITAWLPEDDSARLLKNRPYQLSIREALLIAFGLALQEWTGEDKALVRVIGQGRDLGLGRLNLTRTIGWLSISYPVILAPGGVETPGVAAGDLGASIRKMRDDLREVPGNGAGYDILRYITLPLKKELAPLTAQTEIIFNFLGIIDGAGGTGDDTPLGRIEVSKIPMGWMKSPESPKEYTLDVNVYFSAGRLEVSLDYNRLEYEEETIRNLGDLFLGNLRRILMG
jgi:surfactin family lipopeptide synthetase A